MTLLIKFKKVKSRWRAHPAYREDPIFAYHYYFYPEERVQIAKTLKSAGFDSYSYEGAEGADVSLCFKDPADEAAFMLWASGGIEI